MKVESPTRRADPAATAAAIDSPSKTAARPVWPEEGALRSEWKGAFERIWSGACGDITAVPWPSGGAHPALVAWLDECAPGLVRPGAAAAVVGCGAGGDAAELAARGYDITAFDISPSAVEWARIRFPHLADCFLIADVIEPPRMLCRRADLVVDDEMLAWLPPPARNDAAAALAAMARPRGLILVVPGSQHAPFAFSTEEIAALMGAQGWVPLAVGACGGCIPFRRA